MIIRHRPPPPRWQPKQCRWRWSARCLVPPFAGDCLSLPTAATLVAQFLPLGAWPACPGPIIRQGRAKQEDSDACGRSIACMPKAEKGTYANITKYAHDDAKRLFAWRFGISNTVRATFITGDVAAAQSFCRNR